MFHHVRQHIEEREKQTLSPFAACALDSAGREMQVEPDPVRTCYQRDRDRILHSKSFRRLKHKTQVFIDPAGDHYRTRLTHTLEVAQVARTIGRALRLNEDLIEAIALGHDVGHPPFGHAGEFALDESLHELKTSIGPTHFKHHEQSLRVLQVLEPLNLSLEVIAGVGGHSKGRNDLSAHDGEPTSTLEAAVVRISDRIAYLNHDLDDAFRSGMLTEVPAEFNHLGLKHGERVGNMVLDVIENSLEQPSIKLSPQMLSTLNLMKEWLFENVYTRYPIVFPDIGKAQNMVRELFNYYLLPGNLPEGYIGVQGAVDYVAGMTDRFALETYCQLKMPSNWRN